MSKQSKQESSSDLFEDFDAIVSRFLEENNIPDNKVTILLKDLVSIVEHHDNETSLVRTELLLDKLKEYITNKNLHDFLETMKDIRIR